MSRSPRPIPEKGSPLRTVSIPALVDTTLDEKPSKVSVGHAKTKHAEMGNAETGHAKKRQKSNRGKPKLNRIKEERQPPQSPRPESYGDDFNNGDSANNPPGLPTSMNSRNDVWSAVSQARERRQPPTEPFSSSSRPTYGPAEAEAPERAVDRRQESPERVSSRSKSIHGFDEAMKRERARLILRWARANLRATTPSRAVSPPFTSIWPRPAINLPSVQAQKKRFGPAKRVTLDGLPILTKSASVRASRPRRRSAQEINARVKPKSILKRPNTLAEGSSPSPLQTDGVLQAMLSTNTPSGSTKRGAERPNLESILETEELPDYFKRWREGLAPCWKDKPTSQKPSSPEPVDEWPVLEFQPTFDTEDPDSSLSTRFIAAPDILNGDVSTAECSPARDPPPTLLDSLFEGTRIWSDGDSSILEAVPNTHESLETQDSDPSSRRRKLVRKQTKKTVPIVVKKEKFDWMKRGRSQPSGEENIDPRLEYQPDGSMRALLVMDQEFRVPEKLDKGS